MSTSIRISCKELCDLESVNEECVLEAVDHGIINPLEGAQLNDWIFSVTEVIWFKKAIRLQQDLELDWVSISMVVELLQHKELLEQENQLLRQRLDRFISQN